MTLEQQAYEEIRSWIISGRLQPGERIVETEVAEELGLSRTTTRNAMARLAQSGLIMQAQFKAWTVTRLTSVDAWELWTLRASLESLAAALAAEHRSDQQADELDSLVEQLLAAENNGLADQVTELDFEIHRAIVIAAGHNRLRQAYGDIESQVRMIVGSSNSIVPEAESIYEQHRPLVAAIREKDTAAARTLAESHARVDGMRLITQLETQEKDQHAESAS